MRIAFVVAALLLPLAACPGDDSEAPPPEGSYSLTWTCLTNCEIDPPLFVAAPQAVVAGVHVVWEGANGHPESDIEADTTPTGSCLHHEASNAGLRNAFDLCSEDCDGVTCATAEISWDYPTRRTWSVVATPAVP